MSDNIFDHRSDHVRTKGRGIHFSDTLDAARGLELQEYEVTSAEARRRIADDKNL
jgi:hypothetical protein